MVLALCIANIVSFVLVAKCCEMTGTYNYLEIGQKAFGKGFGTFTGYLVSVYATCSLVSFLVLSGDFLLGDGTGVLVLWAGADSWIGSGGFAPRCAVLFSLSFFVLFPLSMLRSIEALKYTSGVSAVATIMCCILCVYQVLNAPEASYVDGAVHGNAKHVEWIGFPTGVWAAVPIINVAFTAQYVAACCLLLAAAAANRSLPRLCLSGTTRAVTIWS